MFQVIENINKLKKKVCITKTLDLLYFLYKHNSVFQHLVMEKSSKNQTRRY